MSISLPGIKHPSLPLGRRTLMIAALVALSIGTCMAHEAAGSDSEFAWERSLSGALRKEQAPAAAIVARILRTEQAVTAQLLTQSYAHATIAHKDRVSYDWSADDDLEFTQGAGSCDLGCGVNRATPSLSSAGEVPPSYLRSAENLIADAHILPESLPGNSLWDLSQRPPTWVVGDFEHYGLETLDHLEEQALFLDTLNDLGLQAPNPAPSPLAPPDLFSGSGASGSAQPTATPGGAQPPTKLARAGALLLHQHFSELISEPDDSEEPAAVPEPGLLATLFGGFFLLTLTGRTRSDKRL